MRKNKNWTKSWILIWNFMSQLLQVFQKLEYFTVLTWPEFGKLGHRVGSYGPRSLATWVSCYLPKARALTVEKKWSSYSWNIEESWRNSTDGCPLWTAIARLPEVQLTWILFLWLANAQLMIWGFWIFAKLHSRPEICAFENGLTKSVTFASILG